MVSSVETTLLPLSLVIIGAFANALLILITDYVESVGGKWYQVLMAQYWINLLLILFYWILSFSFNYFYHVKDQISSSNSDLHISQGFVYHDVVHDDDTSPVSLAGVYDIDEEIRNYNNLMQYLFSVFPTMNKNHVRHWSVLFVCSMCGVSSYAALNIALLFITSGNAMLMETLIVIIINLSIGVIFFHEDLNKITCSALLLCIIGLILVTQPQFIFDQRSGNDYNTISINGFVAICISCILRGIGTLAVKFLDGIKFSRQTAIIVPQIIISIVLVLVYLIGVFLPSLSWNWNTFGAIDTNNNEIELETTLLLICLGILFFVWILTAVICSSLMNSYSDQTNMSINYDMETNVCTKQDVIRVVHHIEIIIVYVLAAVWLNENENVICYIGACLATIGCVVVSYERYWISSMNSNNTDDRNGNDVDSIRDDISDSNDEGYSIVAGYGDLDGINDRDSSQICIP